MPDALIKALVYLPHILLAVSAHEAAHAWAAWRLGDPTARDQGRITLLPFVHIDLWGTLILPGLLLALPGNFLLGYAKPTPVDPGRLRRPKRDFSLVALAGPLGNLGLALAFTAAGAAAFGFLGLASPQARLLVSAGIVTNSVLAFLNLLPLPGFDGLKALYMALPESWCWRLQRADRYFLLVLVLAMLLDVLAWALVPGWWVSLKLCDLAGTGLPVL